MSEYILKEKLPSSDEVQEKQVDVANFRHEWDDSCVNNELVSVEVLTVEPQTQIITFEILSDDDDIQELATFPFDDIFDDSLDQSLDQSQLSEIIISQTPPPQEFSSLDNQNVTQYLFSNQSLTDNGVQSQSKTKKKGSSSSKRISQKTKSTKRPVKIKKLEGYTCKLNSSTYQVISRDLNILEALEKAIKTILRNSKNERPNLRLLRLQLNQVETVLGVLQDERLDLCIPQELWNEMISSTEESFFEARDAFNVCCNKKKCDGDLTEELSTCFSQSLTMISSQPSQPTSRVASILNKRNQENPGNQKPDEGQHHRPVDNQELFELNSSDDNEIQVLDVIVMHQASANNESLDEPLDSLAGVASFQEDSDQAEKQVAISRSRSARMFTSTQIDTPPDSDRQETTRDSFLDLDDSIRFSQVNENAILSTGAIRTCALSPIPNESFDCSQMTQEVLSIEYESFATHNDTSLVCTADNSQSHYSESLSSQANEASSKATEDSRLKRLSKITQGGFRFHQFIASGVLSPGKNILKMTFNDRVYVGSLTRDGTIEMNGFTFPNVSHWIKSVEGKIYSRFSRRIRRTLSVQYNGKPLEDLLHLEEHPRQEKNQKKSTDQPPPTEGINSIKRSLMPQQTNKTKALKNPQPQTQETVSSAKTLQLVPDELTLNVKTIFLHTTEEYFPTCQCIEQYWNGSQPFPKHLLDEIDHW